LPRPHREKRTTEPLFEETSCRILAAMTMIVGNQLLLLGRQHSFE
jgi:hypothetical protein